MGDGHGEREVIAVVGTHVCLGVKRSCIPWHDTVCLLLREKWAIRHEDRFVVTRILSPSRPALSPLEEIMVTTLGIFPVNICTLWNTIDSST